jgi:hypothetical protein
MINFLAIWLGYLLIFMACDIKRSKESKIKIISWNFLIQSLLIIMGGILIGNYQPEI